MLEFEKKTEFRYIKLLPPTIFQLFPPSIVLTIKPFPTAQPIRPLIKKTDVKLILEFDIPLFDNDQVEPPSNVWIYSLMIAYCKASISIYKIYRK